MITKLGWNPASNSEVGGMCCRREGSILEREGTGKGTPLNGYQTPDLVGDHSTKTLIFGCPPFRGEAVPPPSPEALRVTVKKNQGMYPLLLQ